MSTEEPTTTATQNPTQTDPTQQNTQTPAAGNAESASVQQQTTSTETTQQAITAPQSIVQLDQASLTRAMQTFMEEWRQQAATARRETETKGMSPEQILEYDRKQFEAQKTKELSEIKTKANRLYAAQKVVESKFPQSHLDPIVQLVMADDEKTIDANITALRKLVDEVSKAEITAKFKEAGYNPDSGKGTGPKTNIGEEIAKSRNQAAAPKQENDLWA